MKITYISHAALLIETNNVRILTDPWIAGAAYCDQWYPFPKPVEDYEKYLKNIDYVFISHGHEDHVHHDTLKLVDKRAKVFFPFSWFESPVGYFQSLGFEEVTEAVNKKCYHLKNGVKLTYYANNLDNVMVIGSEGKVIVDVNDALPSTSPAVIDYFIKELNDNYPQIDYLFSSYGGASYYPNTIKCSWKDDKEIGRIRETYFLNNFCKIASGLKPKFAIPFASDFALLDDHQMWINEVKFQKKNIHDFIASYHPEILKETTLSELYSGDFIENKDVFVSSAYHNILREQNLLTVINNDYSAEIEKKRHATTISEEHFQELLGKVDQQVREMVHILPQDIRKELIFSVQITDYSDNAYITVDLRTESIKVALSANIEEGSRLLIKLKSKTLDYSITEEWGGDAIIIGYGCEIEVFEKETIERDMDNYAIQLLTRYPNAKAYIKRNPFRAFKYLMSDKIKRKIFFDKIVLKKQENTYIDPQLKEDDLWLSRSNCELCKKCNLPVLTDELAEKYYGGI